MCVCLYLYLHTHPRVHTCDLEHDIPTLWMCSVSARLSLFPRVHAVFCRARTGKFVNYIAQSPLSFRCQPVAGTVRGLAGDRSGPVSSGSGSGSNGSKVWPRGPCSGPGFHAVAAEGLRQPQGNGGPDLLQSNADASSLGAAPGGGVEALPV